MELKVGAKVTPQDLIAHCKKHLAGFKVPRAVVFGELPKTSTGKIQKFELRKQAGSRARLSTSDQSLDHGRKHENRSGDFHVLRDRPSFSMMSFSFTYCSRMNFA